jgi:hypothetical protein
MNLLLELYAFSYPMNWVSKIPKRSLGRELGGWDGWDGSNDDIVRGGYRVLCAVPGRAVQGVQAPLDWLFRPNQF